MLEKLACEKRLDIVPGADPLPAFTYVSSPRLMYRR